MIDEERETPGQEPEGVQDDDVIEVVEETGLESMEGAPLGDEAIQEELQTLQQEISKFKELYLRKLADYDNYRKRQERKMVEFRRYSNAELMRDCLPVLDNLERALAAPGGENSGLRQGVELVLRQFKEILGRYGLSEVDPADQPFDPALHEAIQKYEDAAVEHPTVVQVLQKGFRLGERLVRPALVVVAVPGTPATEMVPERTSEGNNGENHRN
jgi:molecular chaperone GrpE